MAAEENSMKQAKALFAVVIVAILFVLPIPTNARGEKTKERSNGYQLEKFINVKLPVGEERCGPYFIVANLTNKPEKFIFFAYSSGEKVMFGMAPQSKILIKIGKKNRRPVFSNILLASSSAYSVINGTLFSISPKDYNDCPCLSSLGRLK